MQAFGRHQRLVESKTGGVVSALARKLPRRLCVACSAKPGVVDEEGKWVRKGRQAGPGGQKEDLTGGPQRMRWDAATIFRTLNRHYSAHLISRSDRVDACVRDDISKDRFGRLEIGRVGFLT